MERKNFDFIPQKLDLHEIIKRLESSNNFSFASNGNGGRHIRKNVESFHVRYKEYKYHEVYVTSELPEEEAVVELRNLLGKTTSHDGRWASNYALCYDYLNTSSKNNGKERTFVVLELRNKKDDN